MWPCSVACLSWGHGIVSHSQPPLMLCLVFICRSFISWHPMQLQRQHYSLQTSWKSFWFCDSEEQGLPCKWISTVWPDTYSPLLRSSLLIFVSRMAVWTRMAQFSQPLSRTWCVFAHLWQITFIAGLSVWHLFSAHIYLYGLEWSSDQLLTASMSIVGHPVPSRL